MKNSKKKKKSSLNSAKSQRGRDTDQSHTKMRGKKVVPKEGNVSAGASGFSPLKAALSPTALKQKSVKLLAKLIC